MLPHTTLLTLLPILLTARAAPYGYGGWYQPDAPSAQATALPPTPPGGWPKNADGTDNLPSSWSETYDPSTGAMVVDVVYGGDVVVVGDGGYQTGPAAPAPSATDVSVDPNAAAYYADPGNDGGADGTDYSDANGSDDGSDYNPSTDYNASTDYNPSTDYTPDATDSPVWRRQDPAPTDAAGDWSADPSSWDTSADWTPDATDPSYDTAPTPTAVVGDASTADFSQLGAPAAAADAIRHWMSALRWPFQQAPAPTPTTLILAPSGWGQGTTVSLKWRGMPTAAAKRDWVQDDSGNWVWVDPTPTAAQTDATPTAAPTDAPADPWVRPVPWRDQPAETTVDGIVHYDYTGTGLCNWGLGQNGDVTCDQELLSAYLQWMNTHTFAPGETVPPMRRHALPTPAPTPSARFSRPPYRGGPVHAISDLAVAPTAMPVQRRRRQDSGDDLDLFAAVEDLGEAEQQYNDAAGGSDNAFRVRAEADAAYVGELEPTLTAAAADTDHPSATNADELLTLASVSPAAAPSSDDDALAASPLLDDAQAASLPDNPALAALSYPKFSFFALGASHSIPPDAPVASDSPRLVVLSPRDDTPDSVPPDPVSSSTDTAPSDTPPPDWASSPSPDASSAPDEPAPSASPDPSPPADPSPLSWSDTPSPWESPGPAEATLAATDYYYAEPTDAASPRVEPVPPAPTPVAATLPPLFPTGIFATASLPPTPTYVGPPLWTGSAITRPPAPGPDPCGAAGMAHFKRWTRDPGLFPAATGWMTYMFPGAGQCFAPTTAAAEDHNMGHAVTAMEMVMGLKMSKLPPWMQSIQVAS